jgi:hypothetical protein
VGPGYRQGPRGRGADKLLSERRRGRLRGGFLAYLVPPWCWGAGKNGVMSANAAVATGHNTDRSFAAPGLCLEYRSAAPAVR